MNSSYLDHPSEEALERFLLHHAQEDELDRVETHVLACNTCVARLEELEVQMAAVKLALRELSQASEAEKRAQRSRNSWFTFRTMSWASALAAIALTVALTPRFFSHAVPAADVNLSANRGTEIATIPLGKPLHLHLSAPDVTNGPVEVIMVDANGAELWKGVAKAENERVDVNVPKLDQAGTHFLRLYSVHPDRSEGELLREFPFQAQQ